MKEFQTILLDADGTLFDFDACEEEALKLTFHKYGYRLEETTRKLYGDINKDLWKQYERGEIDRNTIIYSRFKTLFEKIGIKNDGITFEDDYQELLGMQHYSIEDAPEVLAYLYGKYDLYIVTNGVTATQRRRFMESGVDKYMKKLFVSEETGYQKPMKEYFDYCFARIDNLDLARTMIIGDSLTSDIKGGNNAGITTCWFNSDNLTNNTDAIVDFEIHNLKDLYEML